MKVAEFKRQLAGLGARFIEGASHTKVYLVGKQSTLPRHPNQGLGETLRRSPCVESETIGGRSCMQ